MKTTMPRAENNYPLATDAELVVAALLSDLRAFDELTRRYRGAVIATVLLHHRNRASAEDLAQEVFLKAFFALPQLGDPARFGGWLRVIARRHAQRHAERQQGKEGSEQALSEEIAAVTCAPKQGEPGTALEQEEEKQRLRAALEKLSVEQRELLLLYACEDWSLARIAEYLSVEEGTARVRLFRARQALRRHWEALDEANTLARTPCYKGTNK